MLTKMKFGIYLAIQEMCNVAVDNQKWHLVKHLVVAIYVLFMSVILNRIAFLWLRPMSYVATI